MAGPQAKLFACMDVTGVILSRVRHGQPRDHDQRTAFPLVPQVPAMSD